MRPPIDPETEIIGQAMTSIVENLQSAGSRAIY